MAGFLRNDKEAVVTESLSHLSEMRRQIDPLYNIESNDGTAQNLTFGNNFHVLYAAAGLTPHRHRYDRCA